MSNVIVVLILILQFVFINPLYWYEYFSDGLGNVRYGFQARQATLNSESFKSHILLQKLLVINENNANLAEPQYVPEFEKNDTVINTIDLTTVEPNVLNQTSSKSIISHNVVQDFENTTEGKLTNKEQIGGVSTSTPKVACNGTKMLEEKKNCSIGDLKLEFPNRIGTNAIITLQGPPG